MKNIKKLFHSYVPAVTYSNAEIAKPKILLENNGKSGVYLWRNLINPKIYIGSSVDLRRRFLDYFNKNHLTTYNCMYICRALLKYGYSNFSLEILEYCEASKCIERKDYYIKLLDPQYNICKEASSTLGRKYSQESQKFIIYQPNCIKIEVTDLLTNIVTTYDSINQAAKALSCRDQAIRSNIKSLRQKPYKGRYTFRLLDGPNSCSSTKNSHIMTMYANKNTANNLLAQPARISIKVTDLKTNVSTIYDSMNQAAKALNIGVMSISQYISKKQTTPYRKRYIFSKIVNPSPVSSDDHQSLATPPKHYPPAVKEWHNSIYTYNLKSTISLLLIDKMVVKLITSYFNSFINLLKTYKKRVFIAKPEIKHTNSKVIIILYIYCGVSKNLELLYKYLDNGTKFSLAGLLSQFYNKKVVLRVIQLRYLQLNPSIIAERLANELAQWRSSPLNSLKRILNKVILPKQNLNNLDKNSLKNLTLLNSISTLSVKDIKELKIMKKELIRDAILVSTKNKAITGLKIQIAGRLTRRATAARAMFKVGQVGILKNIDSSFKGHSVGLLRGSQRPNLERASFSHKTKNGAFCVRVWTSSYFSTLATSNKTKLNPYFVTGFLPKKL